MGRSTIEWLARPGTTPEVWNPVKGCSPVSTGCRNCWAGKFAARLESMGHHAYQGLTDDRGSRIDRRRLRFNGQVFCDEKVLNKPLHWRKPRTVAVCLMGDLFHRGVPDPFLHRIFRRMAVCPQHTFVLLTKRAPRMRRYLSHRFPRPLPNLWLLVSAENQKRWDERVPYLLDTRAAVRGVCVEPMLEPIVMHGLETGKIHWVIFGAESINGRAGRVCKTPWIAGGVLFCKKLGVAPFVKQLQDKGGIIKDPDAWPRSLRVREWPKAKEKE